MKVLVTGGAGYIGSHVVRALQRAGHEAVVYDDLSQGHRRFCEANKVKLWEGDIRDAYKVKLCFRTEKPDAVIHLAAKSLVGGSISNPSLYWSVNMQGSLNVIEAAVDQKVQRFVFSSTAAVYGSPKLPDGAPIDESCPPVPINPYGWTKLAFEQVLTDYARPYGIGSIALRYFNVAGASKEGDLGEDHDPETHLIPNVLAAARRGETFYLFGDDYPTRDGTCVRDYIHVEDVAVAHVRAVEAVLPGSFLPINLGTEEGVTVNEVLHHAVHELEVGQGLTVKTMPRRAGDPAVLIASNRRARDVLDWTPKRNLGDMIASAYAFMLKNNANRFDAEKE